MLEKRQTNADVYDNDDNDDDGTWGYSTVSNDNPLCEKRVANTSADSGSHQMGRRWCYSHTTRTMARLGSPARSTKDEARSASAGIPQSRSIRTFQ